MATKKNRKSALSVGPRAGDKHNATHGKGGLANALRKATTLSDLEKAYGVLKQIKGAAAKTKRQWATTYEVCKKALESKETPLPKAGEAGAGEALSQGAAENPVPAMAQNEEANPEGEDDAEE